MSRLHAVSTAGAHLRAHEVVVVLVGALLGGRQLSLQLLDLVAVRQQLIVVAVDLARPVANGVTSVTFYGLFSLECFIKAGSAAQVAPDADKALRSRAPGIRAMRGQQNGAHVSTWPDASCDGHCAPPAESGGGCERSPAPCRQKMCRP